MGRMTKTLRIKLYDPQILPITDLFVRLILFYQNGNTGVGTYHIYHGFRNGCGQNVRDRLRYWSHIPQVEKENKNPS
jgi:hypothetical protein